MVHLYNKLYFKYQYLYIPITSSTLCNSNDMILTTNNKIKLEIVQMVHM